MKGEPKERIEYFRVHTTGRLLNTPSQSRWQIERRIVDSAQMMVKGDAASETPREDGESYDECPGAFAITLACQNIVTLAGPEEDMDTTEAYSLVYYADNTEERRGEDYCAELMIEADSDDDDDERIVL